jgi:tRNA pseudouridine38-40 synthase
MVRIFTGTLMDGAYGRISPEEITEITEAKDRRRAGSTAPPDGLYLNKVVY